MKNFSEKTKRRIQLLRRLKRHRELVARQSFDRNRGRAEAIRGRLAELDGALADKTAAVRKSLTAGGPVDMTGYAASVRDVRRMMAAQAELLAEAEKLADAAREEFLAARREREAADLLADRIADSERDAARLAETRELDEIAAASAAV